MEYNKIFNEEEQEEKEEDTTGLDIDYGQNWLGPQCIKCIYNKGRYCTFYKKDRLEVDVDIFNCPEFVEKVNEKKKAMDLFNLK